MGFTLVAERIVAIDALTDPDRLPELDLAELLASGPERSG